VHGVAALWLKFILRRTKLPNSITPSLRKMLKWQTNTTFTNFRPTLLKSNMKLRLQTDYALRTLILLGHENRKMTATEIADTFLISKDHLVKVIQQLSRLGYVRATPGRHGGVVLTRDSSEVLVREVIQAMEGASGVLPCVDDPAFCPMEPGCRLRRILMEAEAAFYSALGSVSVADLFRGRSKSGIVNLDIQ